MTFYIWLTLIAFALFAAAAVIDKILLRRAVPEPGVYAFFISLLGLLVFALAPWGFNVPAGGVLLETFIAGAFFTVGLYLFFCALKAYEASRVLPIVGSAVAIETLLGETLFLGTRLSGTELAAFVMLLAGGVLLMYERRPGRKKAPTSPPHGGLILLTLLASVFFAVSFVFTKLVYEQVEFINGLIWIRIWGALAAFLFLFQQQTRQAILTFRNDVSPRFQILLLFGQALGGVGAVLQNFAVKLGSVSLVTALQGSQYGFLFLFVILLSRRWPEALAERLDRATLVQKFTGIAIVIVGLLILVF